MKNPWIAAVLNFFLMGAGTLYNGRRKAVGLALTIGAALLTYVELSLQSKEPTLWAIMFAAVFIINTLLAYDGYTEAKAIVAK
ncbi:MAG TPA: hypothetical protein VI547_10225 [Anaerolineales bacterium]|nr:hypothetical protein [Anaerolineales bacterium]HLF02341.1 hypothetical protein [Anaerolineales bacterium]